MKDSTKICVTVVVVAVGLGILIDHGQRQSAQSADQASYQRGVQMLRAGEQPWPTAGNVQPLAPDTTDYTQQYYNEAQLLQQQQNALMQYDVELRHQTRIRGDGRDRW